MKWNQTTLKEISVSSAFGPRFSSDLYALDGNVATLRTTDLSADGAINYLTMPLANVASDTFTSHFLQPDDIVVSRSGTIGIVALFVGFHLPVLPGAFLIRFRLDTSKAEPLFYKYYFHSPAGKGKILATATGAVQQNLNLTNLNTIEVPKPPLITQRRIASILSVYDDLIENNLKRIKLLEEKAFLSYKLVVKSEKLEKHILSEFGEVITGKTPSTTVHDYFGDDVPFIKTPDMHKQIFIEYTEQSLSELGAKSQEKKYLPPLTLCVSCIGTAGVVGITSKPSQTNQQINSIIFSKPRNVYFFYALMSQMKEQLEALGSNGSTFTNVNKSKFENMEIFIPKQKVLDEFADGFEAPFKLILALQKQNAKLREARDILLPRLMSGEIEV